MGLKFGLVFCHQSLTAETMDRVHEETVEQTLLAEKLGYHSALVCEHHFTPHAGYYPQPLVAAALAAVTRRIRVGRASCFCRSTTRSTWPRWAPPST